MKQLLIAFCVFLGAFTSANAHGFKQHVCHQHGLTATTATPRVSAAQLLTKDVARRIAANIAKLPILSRK